MDTCKLILPRCRTVTLCRPWFIPRRRRAMAAVTLVVRSFRRRTITPSRVLTQWIASFRGMSVFRRRMIIWLTIVFARHYLSGSSLRRGRTSDHCFASPFRHSKALQRSSTNAGSFPYRRYVRVPFSERRLQLIYAVVLLVQSSFATRMYWRIATSSVLSPLLIQDL